MASDPLKAYRPNILCRIAGHNEARSFGDTGDLMGYCRRCFLPTVPKLIEDLETFRELLKSAEAIEDLKGMVGDAGP